MEQRAQYTRSFDVHFNSYAAHAPRNSRIKIFEEGYRTAKTAKVWCVNNLSTYSIHLALGAYIEKLAQL